MTTGGEVAALASTFQILPGIPVVNAPSPAGAPQGGSATVSFTSQFTHWVAGQTLVSFGTGVTVNQFTVLGPTSATATIAVSPTTVTGGRVVTFTTGGEIVTGTFNVTTGPAALTPLVPGSARQGESLTVELIGTATHWEQDVTTLSFAIGAPSGAIQVSQLTINSPTSATAQITVTPEASIGLWSVSMATNGESISRSNAFDVQPGTPVLLSVSPASLSQGQTGDVVLTGRFTSFAAGQTVVDFGDDINVNTLTVSDPTTVTANITVGVLAFAGLRTVAVTTGPETVTGSFIVGSSAARITQVVPDSGVQGQSLTVAITGADTHFDQALSVASFGGAITVNSLTITSPTTATAAITIAPGATIGVVPVVVSTRGESAVLISAFTILPGTPVLDELSPANGQQGQALDVLVTGRFTTFLQDSTTASFGAGITVNLVTVSSPTSAVVNVTIDALTPAGSRDVTLTTGTQVVTRLSAFGVVPGIAILTAVTPSSGQQGRSVVVAITGSDTHFDQTTTADFGPGITVDSLTVTNATQASASITIDALAQIGLRTVTLQTAGEAAHRVNGFNVLAGTPLVTSLTPITGRQGETLNVTILGQYTNFQQNVSVADFGAGITVHSLTVNAPTSATANISIDPITPLAGRTITVTTGTEVATGGSFQVQAGTAILTQVSPASARQGETVTVDIVGQNTHFAAGATTASVSGSGVAAGAVTVTSATTASLALTLEPFAPAGPRTVTLTTSGESGVDRGRVLGDCGNAAPHGAHADVGNTGPDTERRRDRAVHDLPARSDYRELRHGVAVNTVTVSTPTSATVNITVSPLAATGGRTVTLTTDAQSAQSTAGAFVVQAGNASIASVVPASGQQAQTLDVAITGLNTHFASGQTTVDFGAGVSVNSLTVASLTSRHGQRDRHGGMRTLGAHTVTATTSGEVAQLAGGFTVTAGQPTVVSLSPNQGHQAEQVNVAVTTQFTSMQQGLTTASFGAGITVQSVTVTSATSATISVLVAPTAALGARTVTVTTGTESRVRAQRVHRAAGAPDDVVGRPQRRDAGPESDGGAQWPVHQLQPGRDDGEFRQRDRCGDRHGQRTDSRVGANHDWPGGVDRTSQRDRHDGQRDRHAVQWLHRDGRRSGHHRHQPQRRKPQFEPDGADHRSVHQLPAGRDRCELRARDLGGRRSARAAWSGHGQRHDDAFGVSVHRIRRHAGTAKRHRADRRRIAERRQWVHGLDDRHDSAVRVPGEPGKRGDGSATQYRRLRRVQRADRPHVGDRG